MDEYTRTNRARWDEMVPIHARSGYRMEEFKAGASKLRPLEIEEVGEVTGKSLLHLQCHFGMDTLSWARRGARVTGADFSEQGIKLARSLADELGIAASFVCSPIDDLPSALSGEFEIVFSSYGVLFWLRDMRRWGQVIAHFLAPGGFFYVVDNHPFLNLFNSDPGTTELQLAYSYFRTEPIGYPPECDYADPSVQLTHGSFEWVHTLGEIATALIAAGLQIEFIHEFPYMYFPILPFARKSDDGWWRLPGDPIPLMFSIKARKPR